MQRAIDLIDEVIEMADSCTEIVDPLRQAKRCFQKMGPGGEGEVDGGEPMPTNDTSGEKTATTEIATTDEDSEKNALEQHARKEFGIELDRRRTIAGMNEELEEKLALQNDGTQELQDLADAAYADVHDEPSQPSE